MTGPVQKDAVRVPGEWSPSEHELARRGVRRRLRRRSLLIAATVTVVFLVVFITVILSSPGWPTVRATYFSLSDARDAFPAIAKGFWLNVRLFLITEPLILVVALALAVSRTARAAWLAPVRLLAAIYTDVVRGIPTILLIVLLAFGMPALGLAGIPNSRLFWAGVALVVSYAAYVAEVFRAGIDSIHPSQIASAQALGLSRPQTLRFVVVPQAVRRVLPPLLNDFVSLQKDTALVSSAGVLDAVFAAKDYSAFNFNYTPLVVVAGFFVVITVPLARATDWLQRRLVDRERAGAQ